MYYMYTNYCVAIITLETSVQTNFCKLFYTVFSIIILYTVYPNGGSSSPSYIQIKL